MRASFSCRSQSYVCAVDNPVHCPVSAREICHTALVADDRRARIDGAQGFINAGRQRADRRPEVSVDA